MLSFSLYQQFSNSLAVQQNSFEVIPVDAAIVIESNNLRKVWSEFSETNLLWNKFLSNDQFKRFDNKLKDLDSMLLESSLLDPLIRKGKTLLSIHVSGGCLEIFGVSNCSEESFLKLDNLCKQNALDLKPHSLMGEQVQKFTAKDSSSER